MTRLSPTERNAGFTLLELMFAVGVLASALAILFGSLVTMYTMGEINEGRAKASNHLASILDHIRYLPLRDALTLNVPLYRENSIEMAAELQVRDAGGNLIDLPVVDPVATMALLPQDAVEFRCRVVWQDSRGHIYMTEGVTLYARPGP
ncbi:MAG TPA: prepilin-type N-terminal cleavage/methylation domain-containing protein [Candidatus Hydrogenedentes bacterium]|nr:prepilin-type N-terminal cleavage/methylation domain-containing protein [Candidatus Hydrogenedentota bacterium]